MKDQTKKDAWAKLKELVITRYQLVLFIIMLVLVLVCVILYYHMKDGGFDTLSLCISVFSSIIAALFCTATINIHEMKRKNEIDNVEKLELENNYAAIINTIKNISNKSIIDSGVQKICTEDEFRNDFDALYKKSKTSISILIHGRSFLKKHKNSIMYRFNKRGFETKWFFLDPENSFVDILSRKTDRNSENIKELIKNNTKLLIDEYINSEQLGTLEIYYLKLPPMQAVYIFDTSVVECKYFSSLYKQPSNYVILYNYDRNEAKTEPKSIGNGYYQDYMNMEKESNCVFSSYIHTDRKFKKYLKVKFSDFTSNDWEKDHNNPNTLDFISVQYGNKSILIGYRYFQDDFVQEQNKNFCLDRFREKASNSADTLFFIMGKDGTSDAPKHLVLFKYDKNVFPMIMAKTGKSLEKFKFKITDFK